MLDELLGSVDKFSENFNKEIFKKSLKMEIIKRVQLSRTYLNQLKPADQGFKEISEILMMLTEASLGRTNSFLTNQKTEAKGDRGTAQIYSRTEKRS